MSETRLLLGDCRDVMAAMDENSVDTIITDPPYGLEFMGKGWDHGIPGVEFWQLAYGVAKPGALLLAFGGTRTWHRLACAIEDAGWEIRDTLMWLYGSGFPKSHNIGKAIDKAAGAEREVVGRGTSKGMQGCSLRNFEQGARPYVNGVPNQQDSYPVTAPATPDAQLWDGWGTALKPAFEPIVVAMKPIDGTFVNNALTWGVAGINVDGGRIAIEDCLNGGTFGGIFGNGKPTIDKPIGTGRWPANLLLDEEAAAMLDEQSGVRPAGIAVRHKGGGNTFGGNSAKPPMADMTYADTGGASRFFKVVERGCALCTNAQEGVWNRSLAPTVGETLRTIRATTESIALIGAHGPLVEQIAQNVRSAASLCDSCATLIAAVLVGIKTSAISAEESKRILDSTGGCKSYTLTQGLALFAELWESTDTIPTTKSLSILFGSVLPAIENSTPHLETEGVGADSAQEKATRFRYSAKASRKEREAGCEEIEPTRGSYRPNDDENENSLVTRLHGSRKVRNGHPCVKPIALMRYLVKLTATPTGGVVLDPFMGSGSTGCACVLEGRDFIGIEKEAEYVEIARARIAYWKTQVQPEQLTLDSDHE